MRRGSSAMPIRTVAFCADDYGLAPGIGKAVRDLAKRGRLTATSCMVTGSHWEEEAGLLREEVPTFGIGLHLVLTGQRPLGRMPVLAADGHLPGVGRLLLQCLAGRVPRDEVRDETERQLDRFEEVWGAPPDHIDGHHHVHQFPVIRDIVLDVYERRLRGHGVSVRSCAQTTAEVVGAKVAVPRALLIARLGRGFARRAQAGGVPINPAFRGVRSFDEKEPYLSLLGAWLKDAPEGTLLMCHPGLVDEFLPRLDELTTPREEEYRVLAGPRLPELLERVGVRIAAPPSEPAA
jgi:predicted glycoside hydrolase/deacetylase ChbG (UPF0249 family)